VEKLTRKKTYLKNAYETTSHLAEREERERESVTIRKKAQLLLIRYQGSTLEKKPWGQLAPKFLDLVASTNFWVGKKFSALRAKDFYLN